MKFSHYIILFSALFLVVLLRCRIYNQNFTETKEAEQKIKRAMTLAAENALQGAVRGKSSEFDLSKEYVEKQYFYSLYSAFGTLSSPRDCEYLYEHTKLLALFGDEGISFCSEESEPTGNTYYEYEDEFFYYKLTLSDNIYVVIKKDSPDWLYGAKEFYCTVYEPEDAWIRELAKEYYSDFLLTKENYREIKKLCIMKAFAAKMKEKRTVLFAESLPLPYEQINAPALLSVYSGKVFHEGRTQAAHITTAAMVMLRKGEEL